ncbi:MAG: FlgD immunoglobulin-like domain containing protein [bacterium]
MLLLCWGQALAQDSIISSVVMSTNQITSGDNVTAAVTVDMSGVAEPNHLLGAFSAILEWDPTVLDYVDASDLLDGFVGIVRADSVSTGQLRFNGANATGASGELRLLELTFKVIGDHGAASTLPLQYSVMSAAATFADLLAGLQVTQGEMVVNNWPASFALLEPQDSAVVDTLNPTLVWQQALDPDPEDQVQYDVLVSTSESFADTVWLAQQVAETSYTIPFGLEPSRQYYWKVVAFDNLNGVTASETAFRLATSDKATDVTPRTPGEIPTAFGLSQNYPNPFNPETTIRYTLPEPSQVELAIFNLMGQRVRTLLHAREPAGHHSATWDGMQDNGKRAPSGVYVYTLSAGTFQQTRKMVVLK